jgi:hypothetical protein
LGVLGGFLTPFLGGSKNEVFGKKSFREKRQKRQKTQKNVKKHEKTSFFGCFLVFFRKKRHFLWFFAENLKKHDFCVSDPDFGHTSGF